MSELTFIVAKSYTFGMTWLRLNHQKYGLDPQNCRIVHNPESLKGVHGIRVVLVKGWRAKMDARRIETELRVLEVKGAIKETLHV